MEAEQAGSSNSTRPVLEHWRIYVVGYLVWLILFTVVEGAGRQVCRVPTAKWIAAGADARDRTARAWFRDRADECLDYTRWYRYSMAGLFTLGLIAPFGAVWLLRPRVLHVTLSPRFVHLEGTAVLYGLVFVATLVVTLGTMAGVRWLYDWMA